MSSLVILAIALDLFTFWWFQAEVRHGWEVNLLAVFVYEHWGFLGVVTQKMLALVIMVGAILLIGVKRPDVANKLWVFVVCMHILLLFTCLWVLLNGGILWRLP